MKLAIYLFLTAICSTLVYNQEATSFLFSIGFWGLLYLVWGMLGKLSALSAPTLVLAVRHVDINSPDQLLGIICPIAIMVSSIIILIYIGLWVADGTLRFSHNYTLFNWQKKQQGYNSD